MLSGVSLSHEPSFPKLSDPEEGGGVAQCSGHVAEPFDAGGLQGGVGVQAAGDGVGDDGLAFFFQQFHQPPLFRHQFVDLLSPGPETRRWRFARLAGASEKDVWHLRIGRAPEIGDDAFPVAVKLFLKRLAAEQDDAPRTACKPLCAASKPCLSATRNHEALKPPRSLGRIDC